MSERLPSLAEFEAAVRAAPEAEKLFVSLATAIPFDHETAVTLADRFAGEDALVLLESATAGPNARYSFLAFDPQWTYSWRLGEPLPPGEPADPIRGLRRRLAPYKQISVYQAGFRLGGPDPIRSVGPIGFFGYDTAVALEPKLAKAGRGPLPKQLGLPDAAFFLPQSFLVLDHLARRLFVSRSVEVDPTDRGDPRRLRAIWDAGSRSLVALLSQLRAHHAPPPLRTVDPAERPQDFSKARSALTEAEFHAIGKIALENIKAGEIFQIQLGNRLSVDTAARPFDVFRHLRMLNPSPYMFFLKSGRHHILGASPEMMVGVQDGRVTHRPIAGTRRRTWIPAKDQAMRRELVESEKERAEHVMLVDLGRNDVGRVAAAGSVVVEELMSVEEYSHVFHMVSQVSGTLAPGVDAFEALVAGFPNGTVCGAPKIRALELIQSLEKMSREFYAGSLGLFDLHGNLRSTILIRSIHMHDGVASTQASAGFVYDSTPEEEWLETKNKMAAALLAMQNTL